MAVKTLNIEAGKRLCKVCLTEKKGKAVNISSSFMFPTPEGAVSDGHIIDTVALGNELINQLNERQIKIRDAIFSVTSSKISGREVTLPTVKDDMIRSMIDTNLSDYFPIDVSKYSIDYIILGKTGNESRVLVVAVPNTIVEGYINLGEASGIKIRALDYSSNSQFRITSSISSEEVGMFITIEPDYSGVVFVKDGVLLLQRTIPFGGDDMISAHMEKADIPDYIEALKALHAPCAIDLDEYADSISRLVGGISRSVDFFRSSKFGGNDISKVILMGTCSHLMGLKERISESTGLETNWLEELEGVAHLANSINDISNFIGCLGAGIAPMKFLPKAYLDKIGGNNASLEVLKEKYGYLIGGICLAVSIGLVATGAFNYYMNKRDLDSVNTKISNVQYAKDNYDTYEQYKAGRESLESYVNGSMKNNSRLTAFFDEFDEKMPKNISLLSASFTEDGISMNITIPSYEEAAMVLKQLRTFETLESVSSSAMSFGQGDTPQVSFSVNCKYRVEKTTAAPVEETTASEDTEIDE